MKGAPLPNLSALGLDPPERRSAPTSTHTEAPHMENENKPYIDMMPEDLQALIASSTEGEECMLMLTSKNYYLKDDFLKAFAEAMGFPVKGDVPTWQDHVTKWCKVFNNPLTTLNMYVTNNNLNDAAWLLQRTVLDRRNYEVFKTFVNFRENELEPFIKEFAKKVGRHGNTALMLAMENPVDKEMALRLLKLHPNTANVVDNKGRTALMMLLKSFMYKTDLLDKMLGCMDRESVNTMSRDGNTAFLIAINETQDRHIQQKIIEAGANVDVTNKYGETPLMKACAYGKKEDAEFLIEHRANVNAQDQRGQTPLMIATMNGHKEVVELLIEKRADIELRDNHGDTTLRKAISYNNEDIAKLLIDNGANVNSKDNNEVPMLHTALYYNRMVELLINNGADINIKDKVGKTALGNAVDSRKLQMVRLLIANGADVNQKYGEILSLIFLAVLNDNVYSDHRTRGIVRHILQQGVVLTDTEWDSVIRASSTPEVQKLLRDARGR